MRSIHQEREGAKTRLRGNAEVESAEYLIQADEIDYDQDSGIAEARGHVHCTSFLSGEQLWADRVDYDYKNQTGTFYNVKGSAQGKVDPRPGVLSTGNPFLFQGDWAERLKDRYVLHNAIITNCDSIDSWWTLRAPTIDLAPNDRALAYRSWFRMRRVPLLYAPVFYKDLSANARRSGFLTPNMGNSSRRGLMIGAGYFWAINRSYDLTYRPQYFTTRGLAQTVEFRGRPTPNSDFNTYIYGIHDKGLLKEDGSRIYEGGYLVSVSGHTLLPKGFYARGLFNHLSNFRFRQAFTESFNEAVFSEVNSVAYAAKDWSTYHLNIVFTRQQNFQSAEPGDTILVRKLPQVEFISRDRQLWRGPLPVWVSWNASAGLVRRTQPLFQTRQLVARVDVEPMVMTALRWKQVSLIPALSIRETHYGSSFVKDAASNFGGQVTGTDISRFSRQFTADLVLPSLERIFDGPKWLGTKVKHTIEPRATFRYIGGVRDFQRIVRFDEMDILSNTSELEVSVANRLWTKKRDGAVWDWMSWEVRQRRFFDPNFGGALVPGQRNVFLSSADLTAYAFIDQPRYYSPVVSALHITPRPGFGIEWRSDYDPLRGKLTNSSLTADARFDNYFVSIGHSKVSCVPLGVEPPPGTNPCVEHTADVRVLSPASNQLRGMVGVGRENRRGWNAGFLAIYDYATNSLNYANTQLTYNTSCCAFSGQYRVFHIGTRNENQFRVALVIANIGSFGTLRRQERLF